MTEATPVYSAPIGLAIDGRLTTDLPRDLGKLLDLRAACEQRGAEGKTRNLDCIIAHGALGFAGQETTDAADAASRRTVLDDLARRGFVPNASVSTMLTAALRNDARRFGSSEGASLPNREVTSDPDENVPMLRPGHKGTRSDPLDLLMSTVSTERVSAQTSAEPDVALIVGRVVIRPARALLMSLSELVASARTLDLRINRLHARRRIPAAYEVLLRSNLVALAIGAWDVRTGHEAVERIGYLGGYPGLFEADDNFRVMLRAVVAKDALDWDITISRSS